MSNLIFADEDYTPLCERKETLNMRRRKGLKTVKRRRPRDSPPAVSEPIPGPEEVHHATLSKQCTKKLIQKYNLNEASTSTLSYQESNSWGHSTSAQAQSFCSQGLRSVFQS